MTTTQRTILAAFLLAALALSGCAYRGNVSIYSPTGDANAIDKTVDAQAGYNQ